MATDKILKLKVAYVDSQPYTLTTKYMKDGVVKEDIQRLDAKIDIMPQVGNRRDQLIGVQS